MIRTVKVIRVDFVRKCCNAKGSHKARPIWQRVDCDLIEMRYTKWNAVRSWDVVTGHRSCWTQEGMRKKHDKFLNPEGIAGISIPTKCYIVSMDFPAMIWRAFYRILTEWVLFTVDAALSLLSHKLLFLKRKYDITKLRIGLINSSITIILLSGFVKIAMITPIV